VHNGGTVQLSVCGEIEQFRGGECRSDGLDGINMHDLRLGEESGHGLREEQAESVASQIADQECVAAGGCGVAKEGDRRRSIEVVEKQAAGHHVELSTVRKGLVNDILLPALQGDTDSRGAAACEVKGNCTAITRVHGEGNASGSSALGEGNRQITGARGDVEEGDGAPTPLGHLANRGPENLCCPGEPVESRKS